MISKSNLYKIKKKNELYGKRAKQVNQLAWIQCFNGQFKYVFVCVCAIKLTIDIWKRIEKEIYGNE